MSTTSQETREAKQALRDTIRTRLHAASTEAHRTQSQTAQKLILSLPEYASARNVGIYLSMPGEAQTELLVRDALSKGKRVFVPYLHRPKESSQTGKRKRLMDMLKLHDDADYEGLGKDAWGIPSLDRETVERRENATGGVGLQRRGSGTGSVDFIVVPGVAFDTEGRRLGHGAGFYDEFLARFCADGSGQKPYLVGLCLAEQIVDDGAEIPTSDWDWNVDAVAVGDGRLLTFKDTS